MRYNEIADLKENASCGASSSTSVATGAMPFFTSDPTQTAERSIYGAQPGDKKKKKKKPVVVRR